MKGILNKIFNICWFIFGGLFIGLFILIATILSICLIVPIFFGIPKALFESLKIAFAPAGKKVKLNFEKHLLLNVIYLIFGGLGLAVSLFAYAIGLCCTIIGIPIGLQVFKFAFYFLAPFGAKIR